jgi:hypothetical protein
VILQQAGDGRHRWAPPDGRVGWCGDLHDAIRCWGPSTCGDADV